MIETAFTRLIGVDHPVVSAGMGAGNSDGELAGRVSEAGGLGVIGASFLDAHEVAEMITRTREITSKPFGVNLLLFSNEHLLEGVLAANPAVLSTAWPRANQDLKPIFAKAHEGGIKVMHMVPTLDDAKKAAAAGADVIVAQGTEGGGHIGLMGTTVIVRQVVKAVSPLPVLAAGGIADGAGLAAALALGAQGVLLGTRFYATRECPAPDDWKQAIVASDGHDTIVTSVPDSLTGRDWPGAWSRVVRTRFIEEWLGREPEARRRRAELWASLERAEAEGRLDYRITHLGQCAGLIDAILPAGDVVRQIVAEAEDVLRTTLPSMLTADPVRV
jgi:NAD(P)H-dependent flavin oxidoreductase YrpB (nitropropane dioxygenase family)